MLAALLPILAVPATPLKLEIEAPERVRSGEIAHVKVWLVNEGKSPVVVVAPSPVNYELGIGFVGNLWRDGKPVATNWTGMWHGQWMRAREYDRSSFARVAPGARIVVENAEYRFEYLSGRRPGLISESATAPRRDLPAAEYTYRSKWHFAPTLAQNNAALKAGERTAAWSVQTLTPEAKSLYGKAWRGELSAERPVTILAK